MQKVTVHPRASPRASGLLPLRARRAPRRSEPLDQTFPGPQEQAFGGGTLGHPKASSSRESAAWKETAKEEEGKEGGSRAGGEDGGSRPRVPRWGWGRSGSRAPWGARTYLRFFGTGSLHPGAHSPSPQLPRSPSSRLPGGPQPGSKFWSRRHSDAGPFSRFAAVLESARPARGAGTGFPAPGLPARSPPSPRAPLLPTRFPAPTSRLRRCFLEC